MSKFPKSARHPSLEEHVANWAVLSDRINIEESFHLADIPSLAVDGQRVRELYDTSFEGAAREIVGANALRAVAKSYEALDGVRCLAHGKINLSAMQLGYSASFYAAKAFCMLMGFAPLDRESKITVDIFFQSTGGGRKVLRSIPVLRMHRYEQWGQSEVWTLVRRLVDTMKVESGLRDTKDWLRKAKLAESARIRNAYHYDDSNVAPVPCGLFLDVPGSANETIWHLDCPSELTHQIFVARRLLLVCSEVIERAGMRELLDRCATECRRRNAFLRE